MTKYSFQKKISQSEPRGLTAKLSHLTWALGQITQNGLPTRAFHFGGGLGDHLLCTAVFHELAKRGIQKCWMLSHYPEIFQNNPFGLKVVSDDWKSLKLLEKIKCPSTLLFYTKWLNNLDQVESPPNHIIFEILKKCDINGKVDLRPYWYGNRSINVLHPKEDYICIQSTSTHSSTPMLNKQWIENRLIQCIEVLSKKYTIIQIGSPDEPKLPLTEEGRGLSISESASLLSNAQFFLGQVGFLMHLARAVDTRSVIIFGGREKAWQSGYPCNENLESSPPCSPCWQNNNCDNQKTCMSEIQPSDVLAAVNRLEERIPNPLETDSAFLPEYSKN